MWNSHCCEYQVWFPNQLAAFKSDGDPVYEYLTIRADNADFGSQADDKAGSETIFVNVHIFGNFFNRRHIIIYSSTSTTCLDKELLFCSFCFVFVYWSNLVKLHNLLGQEADPLIHSLRYFPRIFSFISVNLHNLLGQEADPEERRSPGRRRWRASWWLFWPSWWWWWGW